MLLAKSLVIVEGMGRHLDPGFNMVAHLRPFMEDALRRKYSPRRISRDINSMLLSYLNLARDFPRDMKEIINRINRNKFKIDLEHRGLDKLISDFDRSINRLTSSLILAALIIGSSIIMQTNIGPHLLGLPMLAFLGYTVAGMIGLWLVYAIIRSGRL
jgi:ubiquinone biosynthesis protein